MRFRYQTFPGSTGEVLAPIVPIGVSFGDSPIFIACLLDSGADMSFMPEVFADVFGIDDISSGKEFAPTGFTGHSIKTWGHLVEFSVTDGKSKPVYHKELFFFGPVESAFGILGRTFFKNYVVRFNERHRIVQLIDYPREKTAKKKRG